MTAPRYRAPMRSRLEEIPEGAGVQRGLDRGLCGIGGRLTSVPPDLSTAVAQTQAEHGERMARRLVRFAELPAGTEVWTRTPDDAYYTGRLAGPWCYDGSPAARAADLVHVRPCPWTAVAHGEVPEDVLAAFARGGRNFQGIRTAATGRGGRR